MDIDSALLGRLPESAIAKLHRLDSRRTLKLGAAAAAGDARSAAQRERHNAHMRLHELRQYAGASTADAEARLAAATAELNRLAALHDGAREEANSAGQLFNAAREWLGQNRRKGTTFTAAPALAVKPWKGETVFDALDRVRGDIGKLKADLANLEHAPVTKAEARARAEEYVKELGAAGAPHVAALFDAKGGRPGWPTRTKAAIVPGVGAATVDHFDVAAVMCAAMPEVMTKLLFAEIDSYSDDGAVPLVERHGRRAELKAALLDAERAEEALIEQAEDAGLDLARRPDAAPEAVLGVVVEAAAEVAA